MGVLVLAHQGNALCKECFFWGVTLSTMKQAVLAIIIIGVFGNTGWELFQNFFYRLYRLSPSLNVWSGIPGACFCSDFCRFAQIRSVAAWSAYFLPVDWT